MPMISTIALACAGSAAAAVVARWIPKALVPALVFEIAFGIAMGPSGLALLAPGPTMDMLALIGFAVLMLVAGLEIDLGMLLGRQRNSGGASPLALALAMRSEEHTSELQSLMRISYAVFCLKKKNNTIRQ